MYVPALRWRQGEYQALTRLASDVKDRIVPIITIPDVEYDFEHGRLKKTVHEHVHPFVLRYHKKWGGRPAWVVLTASIAAGRMNSGKHVFDYVFDGLRSYGEMAIPALPLDANRATVAAVRRVTMQDGQGVGTIVRLEDLMAGDVEAKVMSMAHRSRVLLAEMDVVIDLRAPNFEPYGLFAGALWQAMSQLGDLGRFRNVVLLSTAIPESFRKIAKGTDELPRHDWLFYQLFLQQIPAEIRRPNYGDYTIVHPNFKALDMRMVKAAAKLIYTKSNSWGTRKGSAFRDNPSQMRWHCAEIIQDSHFEFRGGGYSYGDKYIEGCAVGLESTSNLTRWKDVGINHHMTMVVRDLAKLVSASSIV